MRPESRSRREQIRLEIIRPTFIVLVRITPQNCSVLLSYEFAEELSLISKTSLILLFPFSWRAFFCFTMDLSNAIEFMRTHARLFDEKKCHP